MLLLPGRLHRWRLYDGNIGTAALQPPLTVGFQNHSSDGEKYKTNLGIIFKGLDLFFGMGQKHQILSTKLNAK